MFQSPTVSSLPHSHPSFLTYDCFDYFVSTILNNYAGSQYGSEYQAIAVEETALLVIRNTKIEESYPTALPSLYCCGSDAVELPTGDNCTYPACTSSCVDAIGCNCPFRQNVTFPTIISPSDVSCSSCKAPYSGLYCTTYNDCNNNCTVNQYCADEGLGYQCYCNPGFTQSGVFCYDINECTAAMDNCSPLAQCENTPGGFNCTCNTGYAGDGLVCYDFNECEVLLANNCSIFGFCTNFEGGYNCTCKDGFLGDGFECTDFDECSTAGICGTQFCENTNGTHICTPCGPGKLLQGTDCVDINACSEGICGDQFCQNTNGTYECVPCGPGMQLQGTDCVDDRDCLVNNGGCDWHTFCNIMDSTCSECPLGFSSNSSALCIPLCGDQICDPSLSENCVSCPLDCKNATCDTCGDGECDSNESCDSCYEDCQSKCPKDKDSCERCSKHGTCISGNCVCSEGYTGPACNDMPAPINVVVSQTFPNASITTKDVLDPQQPNLSFGVSVSSFSEFSQTTLIYRENVALPIFSHVYYPPTASINYDMWVSSTTLENKAQINITFIKFNTNTVYPFYTDTIAFPSNTLKMNVRIENWPFKLFTNTLQVEFTVEVKGAKEEDSTCSESVFRGITVPFTQVTFNSTSIYAQFQPNAIVDLRKRAVTFAPTGKFSAVATLPHFWNFAELDPNYVILIDPNACGYGIKSVSNTLLIATVVPIFGLLILLVIIYFIVRRRRKRLKRRRRKLNTARQSFTNVEMKESTSSEG